MTQLNCQDLPCVAVPEGLPTMGLPTIFSPSSLAGRAKVGTGGAWAWAWAVILPCFFHRILGCVGAGRFWLLFPGDSWPRDYNSQDGCGDALGRFEDLQRRAREGKGPRVLRESEYTARAWLAY